MLHAFGVDEEANTFKSLGPHCTLMEGHLVFNGNGQSQRHGLTSRLNQITGEESIDWPPEDALRDERNVARFVVKMQEGTSMTATSIYYSLFHHQQPSNRVPLSWACRLYKSPTKNQIDCNGLRLAFIFTLWYRGQNQLLPGIEKKSPQQRLHQHCLEKV